MRFLAAFGAIALLLSSACAAESEPPSGSIPDPGPDPDEEPVTPVVLSLAVGHGEEALVVRGWPLVLRARAALDAEPDRAYALGNPNVRLAPEGGAALPLSRIDPADAGLSLDGSRGSAEVRFVATAADTARLPLGPANATLSWGEGRRELSAQVIDPPADSRDTRVDRASLEIEAALFTGDTAGAVAAGEAALERDPDSITLLNRTALALEAAGRAADALTLLDRALDEYERQFPDAIEPPVTTLRLQARLIGAAVRP